MNEGTRRSGLAVLASCTVHALVVLSASTRTRATEQIPVEPVWMELQVSPRVQPGDTQPEPPRVHARESLPARANAPRRTRAAPTPAVEEAPSDSPNDDAVAPEATVAETSNQPAAAAIDLSPLAAARTLAGLPDGPRRDAGVARDERAGTFGAGANALAGQVPGLTAGRGPGRSVKGAIEDTAEDAIYDLLRPWKLLKRTFRGSEYRYTGGGFDAAILPDGRVRFYDKGGFHLSAMMPETRESGASAQFAPAPALGFNLGDPRTMLQRLRGKDPFAAERRTFLERTRALREYLSGRSSGKAQRDDDHVDEPAEAPPEPAAGAP